MSLVCHTSIIALLALGFAMSAFGQGGGGGNGGNGGGGPGGGGGGNGGNGGINNGGGVITIPGGGTVNLPGGGTVTIPGGGVTIGNGGITIGGGPIINLPGGIGGGIINLPGGNLPGGNTNTATARIVSESGMVVGTSGTATAVVTGQTPPIAAANGTTTASPASYWWTISGGKFTSSNTGQTVEFTADATGAVVLDVTVATDGTSYTATNVVTVVAANAAGTMTIPASAAMAATVSASVTAAKNNDRTFRWSVSGDAAIASGQNTNAVTVRAGTPGVKEITCAVALQNITTLTLRSYLVVTGNGAATDLAVDNGAGGGRYPAGSVIDIFAAAPKPGAVFERWTGDVATLGNDAMAVRSPHAVVTLPAAGAHLVATYRDTATWLPTTINDFNPQRQTDPVTKAVVTVGTKFIYYLPPSARGLVFLVHAAGGSATDWFGTPESLQIVRQLVASGYGVAALSSVNRTAGTWAAQTTLATNPDALDFATAYDTLIRDNGFSATGPVFFLGSGAGADAAVRYAELLATGTPARPIRGVVLYGSEGSETLALTSRVPEFFVLAPNDATLGTAGVNTARRNAQLLAGRGISANVATTAVEPLPAATLNSLALTTEGFSTDDAQAVWSALKTAGVLDSNSYVKSVPTTDALKAAVPAAYQDRVGDIATQLAVANASQALGSETAARVIDFLDTRVGGAAAPQPARLINLSTRGNVAFVGDSFTAGFTVSGTERATLLIRAAGPALARFRVNEPLPAPHLEVNRGSTVLATNEGWDQAGNNVAQISAAAASVGAFAFQAGTRDAAVLLTLDPGNYTAVVKGVNGTTGDALVEVYDVSKNSSRVTTFSALGRINEAGEVFIPGFGLQGARPRTLLMRVIGPGLSDVGLTTDAVLSNPRMVVVGPNNAQIANNDNWTQGDAAALSAVFASSGAFPLRTTNGDAALTSTFNAGIYSIEASASQTPVTIGGGTINVLPTGQTGVVLVEIYEVP